MCSPIMSTTSIANAFDIVSKAVGITSEASNLKYERENAKYKSQIALNNAKNAQNEAFRIKQEGIEEARKEKLSGLKQANLEKAKMASSGFDINNGNNLLNYEDNIFQTDSQSKTTKENYDLKADDYFQRANSYLDESNLILKNYNDSLYSKSLNYLGNASKVANSWYSAK